MSDALLPPLPDVPMVSVLSLTFNHERYVAEAVESVLTQDWPRERLQYVVLNDGSTDGTARALDPYRDVVRVIDQENVGMLGALHRVLGLMDGDVITAVAGDDAMLPGKIERLVEALQRNPAAGLAYSDAEVIDGDGNVLQRSFLDANALPRVSGRVRGELLKRNFVNGGCCMMRACLKPLFDSPPSFVAWEDYWWAWAISGVAEVVHVPEATYRYRQHGANMSLGASATYADNLTKELPFRLHMLATVRLEDATASEIVGGVIALWKLLPLASAASVEVLVADGGRRGEAHSRVEAAVAAIRRDDLHEAALHCARAAALDALNPTLLAVVRSLAAQLAGGRIAAPDRRPLDALGARRFAVLADARVLLETPELLSAYAARFDGSADATLVIHGPPEARERVTAEIGELVAARGLDGDDSPDMVLTFERSGGLASLAASADAVLGRDTSGSTAPAFALDDLDSLPLLAACAPALA